MVPGNVSTTYCVRIQLQDGLSHDSDWVQGSAFTVTSIDGDGDGVPFNHEIALGLDPTVDDRLLDADGDHFSNAEEAIAGTGLNDPGSVFKVAGVHQPAMITFSSVVGRTYNVHTTTNLVTTNWLHLSGPISGSNALTSVIDTNAALLRYYRIGVELSP